MKSMFNLVHSCRDFYFYLIYGQIIFIIYHFLYIHHMLLSFLSFFLSRFLNRLLYLLFAEIGIWTWIIIICPLRYFRCWFYSNTSCINISLLLSGRKCTSGVVSVSTDWSIFTDDKFVTVWSWRATCSTRTIDCL